MNPTSAKCAQVKRRLKRDEPLNGATLDFALSLVGTDKYGTSMAAKLKAGLPLDSYESHLMIDVYLLHTRLAANAREREEGDAQ